jgi:hypothetical protein
MRQSLALPLSLSLAQPEPALPSTSASAYRHFDTPTIFGDAKEKAKRKDFLKGAQVQGYGIGGHRIVLHCIASLMLVECLVLRWQELSK